MNQCIYVSAMVFFRLIFFAIGWSITTYIHTHTTNAFGFGFFAIGGGWVFHTHTHIHIWRRTKRNPNQKNAAHTYIYSQTKTTQVPNPEAVVLLGEIGYVFRFDNIFLSKERECVCVFFYDR